jgi:NTP pyrophosphatase (non-canonical NTP hydrolase)
MNIEYVSKTTATALSQLVEELGEVTAAAGKCGRFGFNSTNPKDPQNPETNLEWLTREMIDVAQAFANLIDNINADDSLSCYEED